MQWENRKLLFSKEEEKEEGNIESVNCKIFWKYEFKLIFSLKPKV